MRLQLRRQLLELDGAHAGFSENEMQMYLVFTTGCCSESLAGGLLGEVTNPGQTRWWLCTFPTQTLCPSQGGDAALHPEALG